MRNPLVSIDKRVIGCEKITKSRRLFDDAGIEIFATERLKRLPYRRFQRTLVTYARRASKPRQHAAVQLNDFGDRQISH